MVHFNFNDNDNRYLFLTCDNKTDLSNCRFLMKHLNLVNPICNLPSYRGPKFTDDYIWEYLRKDGKIIFYCSIGLWHEIYKFFKTNNIDFDGLESTRFKRTLQHTFDEFKEIVRNWGLKFEPRPYQYETAYNILQWNRSISELATRAGKTLIAYIVFRYCIEYFNAKKILMVVPSIDLVKQGYNDFCEYAEFFKTELVWSGGKLVESSNLTIGTFQSLIKMLDKKSPKYNPEFYNDFDIVFVDEVHRATAAQIKQIITQPFITKCKIMFGMTGTLPQIGTSERFGVHALLGAKIQSISPKELIDGGYISKLKIHQYQISYNDTERQQDLWIKFAEYMLSDYKFDEFGKKIKLQNPYFLLKYEKELPKEIEQYKHLIVTKIEYKQYLQKLLSLSSKGNQLMIEKMMVHEFSERIDFTLNTILPQCDKNTLILAHHTEYINYIAKQIKQKFPDRPIEIVTGKINAKKREQIRLLMKERNDVIIVASYGCMSTGLTLANLCYGIFLESFKSNVINMQSIGRGLGLSDMKDEYILFDIVDCFDRKKASDKIRLQGIEKIKIYKREQYPYDITKITI